MKRRKLLLKLTIVLLVIGGIAGCGDDDDMHCVKDVWNSQTEACPTVWR